MGCGLAFGDRDVNTGWTHREHSHALGGALGIAIPSSLLFSLSVSHLSQKKIIIQGK